MRQSSIFLPFFKKKLYLKIKISHPYSNTVRDISNLMNFVHYLLLFSVLEGGMRIFLLLVSAFAQRVGCGFDEVKAEWQSGGEPSWLEARVLEVDQRFRFACLLFVPTSCSEPSSFLTLRFFLHPEDAERSGARRQSVETLGVQVDHRHEMAG